MSDPILTPSTSDPSSSLGTFPIPSGLTPYTEQTTTILLPDDNTAFLNPIQQFNRDLSACVIGTWGKDWQGEGKVKWEKEEGKRRRTKERKAREREEREAGKKVTAGLGVADVRGDQKRVKLDAEATPTTPVEALTASEAAAPKPEEVKADEYIPKEFVILEALSATGLRAIRFAKEIPGVKYVIANDLSPTAAAAMRRNVAFNGVDAASCRPSNVENPNVSEKERERLEREWEGKVRVNEGDACTLMYNHRINQVDCVDLDPYGTAAPFMDAAIQCCADGGLLAVTCTDMAVAAGHNYPEKCFANYGGVSIKADYSHEVALRLLLNSFNTIAARYGRYIVPMLSLSIDFYIRVFFRVYSSPIQVKRSFSQSGTVYVCGGCQNAISQPFGRVEENKKGTNVNYSYKNTAMPRELGNKCGQCGGTNHVAGPMWLGPLHNPEFVDRCLTHLAENESNFGTVPRMKGMLSLAKEEILSPFYFDPSFMAGLFRCQCPSLNDVGSALLNGGYQVSRTHASAGALKTDAPIEFLHDIFRTYIRDHAPITEANIPASSPAARLVKVPITHEINFTLHPDLSKHINRTKLVRYQTNPTANWGPAGRAKNKAPTGDGKALPQYNVEKAPHKSKAGKKRKAGEVDQADEQALEGETLSSAAAGVDETDEEAAMNL